MKISIFTKTLFAAAALLAAMPVFAGDPPDQTFVVASNINQFKNQYGKLTGTARTTFSVTRLDPSSNRAWELLNRTVNEAVDVKQKAVIGARAQNTIALLVLTSGRKLYWFSDNRVGTYTQDEYFAVTALTDDEALVVSRANEIQIVNAQGNAENLLAKNAIDESKYGQIEFIQVVSQNQIVVVTKDRYVLGVEFQRVKPGQLGPNGLAAHGSKKILFTYWIPSYLKMNVVSSRTPPKILEIKRVEDFIANGNVGWMRVYAFETGTTGTVSPDQWLLRLDFMKAVTSNAMPFDGASRCYGSFVQLLEVTSRDELLVRKPSTGDYALESVRPRPATATLQPPDVMETGLAMSDTQSVDFFDLTRLHAAHPTIGYNGFTSVSADHPRLHQHWMSRSALMVGASSFRPQMLSAAPAGSSAGTDDEEEPVTQRGGKGFSLPGEKLREKLEAQGKKLGLSEMPTWATGEQLWSWIAATPMAYDFHVFAKFPGPLDKFGMRFDRGDLKAKRGAEKDQFGMTGLLAALEKALEQEAEAKAAEAAADAEHEARRNGAPHGNSLQNCANALKKH